MQTLAADSKVRRCLFGPVDHDALRKDLDIALAPNNSDSKNKWNYNFDEDSPLDHVDGQFKWEIVDTEKEYIPNFYTRGYPVKVKRNVNDTSVKSASGNLSSLSFKSCESETCNSSDKSSEENTGSVSSQSSVNVCNKTEKRKIKQTQISGEYSI